MLRIGQTMINITSYYVNPNIRVLTSNIKNGEEKNPNGVTETEPDYIEAMAVLSAGMRRI